MALDFLLDLLKTIPSINYNAQGGATPYLPQQEALASKYAATGDALMDPNNPLYKQQYQASQDRNKASLAQTIAEAQGQNRMATATGRTPLFDPERGGETLFRSLMQGYQGLDQTANTDARASLTQAQDAYGKGLAGYNALTPYGAQSGYQKGVLPYQGIASLFGGSGNSGGSGGANSNAGNGYGPINWAGSRAMPGANGLYNPSNFSWDSGRTLQNQYTPGATY